MINRTAADGFGAEAASYERGRPSYPDAAVAFVVEMLGVGPDRRVVDLAAGTGKFTRLLVPTGAEITAVEPVANMRVELAAAIPDATVLDGRAEAIPLPNGSADAVTVAQAFHWFQVDAALAEIARVLRPGSGLAMVWNRRDESVPWVARMSEVTAWHDRDIPQYDHIDWVAAVAATGRFGPLGHRSFPYEQTLDRAGLADRVRSISYVAAMAPDDQADVVRRVVALADGFTEPFVLPYQTHVYWCTTI